MFSGSVNADFVLALPFHHGELEPDSVGVSTGGLMQGGGGAYARWGAYLRGTTVYEAQIENCSHKCAMTQGL